MKNQYIIETIETKTGDITLKVNDYFLHSKYNPKIEAQKFAENHYEPHHVHILFGYGLGYIVDSLKEKLKFNEPLIVIDPLFDDSLLKVQDRHKETEFEQFLYNSNSIKNLEYIVDSIKELAFQRTFKIISSPNYDKIFPDMYLQILKQVKDIQQKSIVNENTINRDSEMWQKNLSENLLSIFEDRNLDKLYQVYSCPVVIASGGPSLTKQLPLLKEIQNNVVIIAAGSTINSLVEYCIEPDYVVSIDGKEVNYNQFKDLHLRKAKLMYSIFNQPKIRSEFNNEAFAFTAQSDHTVNQYLTNKLNINLPRIIGGGSVAHFAFTLAQYITSGPIALIGQDLAYTNNQTHAANNKQAESIEESWKTSNNMFTVEGFDGEDIWTSTMLYSMKLTFEQLIKEAPPKNIFYNCTEGGVRLNGFEQKIFNEFCTEYIQEEIPNKNLGLVNKAYKVSQDEWGNLKGILEEELKDYARIIKHLSKGLSVLEGNKSRTVFSEKALKILNKIDKEITVLYPKVQMNFIVAPITLEVLKGFLEKENETPTEMYTRVYNQTKTLYSKLLEAARKSKTFTEHVIERINNEKIKKGEE
ncbi:6-hydroxymethylpterin diphosphokinase MptE-like protein [Lysinibacillus sp. FSL M8-0216]|uniref:motility associated factor glycosyltransferase family protein n=1 Tax=Lysinibacillus sp. FSL M8-0216 TaxID=2921619 RepID=UPI00315A274E